MGLWKGGLTLRAPEHTVQRNGVAASLQLPAPSYGHHDMMSTATAFCHWQGWGAMQHFQGPHKDLQCTAC